MTPNEPDDLLLGAQTAYEQGDLTLADRLSRQALAAHPTDVAATVLHALVCARTGRRAAAIAYLQNAVQREPASFEAHASLSTLLFAAGRTEDAIRHGKRSVELQPNDEDAYRHFARDLISHGELEDAMVVLRKAVEMFPQDVPLHQDLAAVLADLGKSLEAMQAWERVLTLDQDLLAGWLKLGGFRLAMANFEEAIRCGREAVRIDGNSADAHVLLALGLTERNGAVEAEGHLRRAIELNPGEYLAHAALGIVLQEQGRFGEAEAPLRRCIEIRPTHGLAYQTLLRARKAGREDEPLIAKIEALTENDEATLLEKSHMHYALGKAREDLGDFHSAMAHYDKGNELAAEVWFADQGPDNEWYDFMVQRTIETFTRERLESLASTGLESDKPLLVVGMMRSGTTLTEQILSSHPKIEGGGELTYWHDIAASVFDPGRRTVDERGLRRVAQGYLQELEKLSTAAARVTDKLPHNYVMLGLVLSAFPNARVIHVRRNAVDNCLSIYTTDYQKPPAFALIRENIVFAYRQYQRIMDHWRRVLPGDRLLEIEYENLIADRETVTRRMIEFAGVEWDDACLHHEQNVRCVNTPSVWQVRQPLYKTSIERWRKFEPWLREFAELKTT